MNRKGFHEGWQVAAAGGSTCKLPAGPHRMLRHTVLTILPHPRPCRHVCASLGVKLYGCTRRHGSRPAKPANEKGLVMMILLLAQAAIDNLTTCRSTATNTHANKPQAGPGLRAKEAPHAARHAPHTARRLPRCGEGRQRRHAPGKPPPPGLTPPPPSAPRGQLQAPSAPVCPRQARSLPLQSTPWL